LNKWRIGAYANSKEQAAKDAGDTATADAWAEGGTDRVFAHIAGGALIGGLGGGGFGSAFAGAAGAGVSATVAGKLNGVADSIGGATGSMTVGNTVSNVLAGLSGALVGGTTGAFTASNADLYNRDSSNGNGTGDTGSPLLDKGKQLLQATLDLVPGHKMADQAQAAYANGNYGTAAMLGIGSIVDAGVGVLTGGESSAVEQLVSGTKTASVQLSQQGLDLVASHLGQFGDDAANAGMLQRLQSAFATGQSVTGADANFYLHEITESTLMSQGLSYDAAHAAAISKYGVSPFALYAPEVIDANPTLFNNAWRSAAGLSPLK
jgi:filamentous hemagglutinin